MWCVMGGVPVALETESSNSFPQGVTLWRVSPARDALLTVNKGAPIRRSRPTSSEPEADRTTGRNVNNRGIFESDYKQNHGR